MKDNSRKRLDIYVYLQCVMGKRWELITFYMEGTV